LIGTTTPNFNPLLSKPSSSSSSPTLYLFFLILQFKEGSLRVSPQFPSERLLVELISPKSELLIYKTDDVGLFQGVENYYKDNTFRDILFDSSFHGSGIRVVDTARVRITNSYFLNFTSQGILVQGGHETFISTCFLGQRPTSRTPRERSSSPAPESTS
ncbi:Polygalacturonase QRT3, partial [Linum perenne]